MGKLALDGDEGESSVCGHTWWDLAKILWKYFIKAFPTLIKLVHRNFKAQTKGSKNFEPSDIGKQYQTLSWKHKTVEHVLFLN